jgi:hypothetical protein
MMAWPELLQLIGPIAGGIAVYAGIRADLKVLKFKVNTLWQDRYGWNARDTL